MPPDSITNRLRRILSAIDDGELPDNLCVTISRNSTLVVESFQPYGLDESVYQQIAEMFPSGSVQRDYVESGIERCSYRVPDVITVYFSRKHVTHDGEYTADTRDRGSNQRWMTWRHTCCGCVLLVREMKAAGLYLPDAFTPGQSNAKASR